MKQALAAGFARVALSAVLLAGWGAAAGGGTAHAGLYDRVRDIFELPGEVDQLKKSYDETLEQLEAARQQTEEYRRMQERLLAENAKLLEQNRELAAAVQELRTGEEARSKHSDRIRRMIWTAALLAAGYFAVTRLARFVMRARTRE